MDDPCVHNWVKVFIAELEEKDPVDVIHDLEVLLALTLKRMKEVANG